MISLVDDHDLESLLGALVDLLRLGDLLQQVLHHHSVVIAYVGRRDLHVVDRGDDIELEFPVGGGLEDPRVDLDLLDTRAVKLLERGNNASLLTRTRWSVDQQVREVSALSL